MSEEPTVIYLFDRFIEKAIVDTRMISARLETMDHPDAKEIQPELDAIIERMNALIKK